MTAGTLLFGWINSARYKAYARLVIEFGRIVKQLKRIARSQFCRESAILSGREYSADKLYERISDDELIINDLLMLHVFRIQNSTVREQSRCNNHGIIY